MKPLSRSTLAGGAFLVFATLLAYGPALGAGFIWDDDLYVTANPLVTGADGLADIWLSTKHQSQYFPLVYTTLRLQYALWGADPFGFHLVNVLLHGANALLVWAVLRRLAVPGAWFAAALFALHPVQVETVAWVTELKNTQSTFFYGLSLLAWMKLTDGSSRPAPLYALALAAFLLALFSKTTACTLPAALVLVLWLRRQPIDLRRIAQIAPFVVLGIGMGLVSVFWEGHLGNYAEKFALEFTLPERLLIASRALWFYLGKLAWPVALTFTYPRWELDPSAPGQWLWLLACVGVAAALGWLWLRRRAAARGPIAAAAFFVATLVPMLGFVSLFTFYYAFVADHYQYLACVGPIALFSAAVWRPSAPWRAGSLALLGLLGLLTWQQAGAYHDLETLWRDTLAKNPASWMAHNNLGALLAERGERGEAEAHYRASLALNPSNGETHYNLANLLLATRRKQLAVEHYRQALAFYPEDADFRNNLGVALFETGRTDEAIVQYREAVRLAPDFANAHFNLGTALAVLKEWDEAEREFETALRLDPQLTAAATRLRALRQRR